MTLGPLLQVKLVLNCFSEQKRTYVHPSLVCWTSSSNTN